MEIKAGSTSITKNVMIYRSDTGAPMTGLAYNTASLTAYYVLPRAASVAITLATQTVTGAYSSGGFVEIDATNCPGLYRFDIPNAALASGRWSNIHLQGAANMAPCVIEIDLTGWDNQDGVRGGMTALPNAAAEAAGGLYTRGTGAGQINQTNNGQIDANAARLGGTTCTGRDIGASVLLSSGTGTGQVTLTSGRVNADITHIAAAAVSTSTAQLGVNVVNFGGSAGTFASGRPEVNTSHISGSAVSTSSAQIGVNVVNAGATAWNSGAITANTLAADTLTAAKVASDVGTEIGTAVWATAARTLTANTNLNDLNAAGVAAAVWDAATATYGSAGSYGLLVETNLDSAVSTRATQTSVDDLPTNAELATALGTADDAVLAQIALVKAQTDLIPSDPADASVIAGRFDTLDTAVADLPTNAELTAALGTADDAVLAQVALVKTETDKIASIKTKTDSLTFTVAGQVDANAESMNGSEILGNGSSGDLWRGA